MTIYTNPPIKIKLKSSTAILVPLPPFSTINASSIYVSNTIIIGNNTSNVVINSTSVSTKTIFANGSIGLAGQVLTSNGTGIYWSSTGGGIGLNAGNGLSSNATDYFVLANSGIVANSTGTFVNASYIATLTANDSTNFGGLSLATVQSQFTSNDATTYSNATAFASNATNISTGTIAAARLATSGTPDSTTYLRGDQTWAGLPATPPGGSDTQVQFNDGGIFGGNNLFVFEKATSRLTIGNNTVNTAVLPASILVSNSTSQISTNSGVILVGNATVNVSINSTAFSGTANNATNLGGVAAANYVNTSGTYTISGVHNYTANLVVNTANQLLIGNATVNAVANQTTFFVANSTTNTSINPGVVTFGGGATINNTIYSGTANNATNLGGVAAASYINTTGAYTITGVHTRNANLVVNSATLSVGNTTSNVTTNTTHIVVGNSTVNATINSTAFTGTAANITGVLGYTSLPANVVIWSNTNSYSAVQTYNSNLVVNSATLSVGNTTANITANTTVLTVGNSTVNVSVNSTTFSGTANNATNFNGQPASFYANATNLTTGLVNTAQLATSGTPDSTTFLRGDRQWVTVTGGTTNPAGSTTEIQFNDAGSFGANNRFTFDKASTLLTVGDGTNNTQINSTSVVLRTLIANSQVGTSGQVLTSSGAGANVYWQTLSAFSTSTPYTFTAVQTFNANLVVNSATLSVGNTTSNVTTNTTHIVVGNSTVNVSINSTAFSGTANNATNLGGVAAANYINTSGAYTITGVHTRNANLVVNAATLSVGNTTSNVTTNTTHIVVGNSTVNVSINSTAFSGTANDSTNLGNQPASYYTNATNLSTGTLNHARLPANVVIWSNTNTYTAVQTYNANLFVNAATLSVGNTTSNVTVNTTVLTIGDTTVNTQINSTALVVKSLIANGSIGGVGDLLASNGTGLYWTSPPSGSFSNGTAYTWSAVQTFQANVVLQDRLSANGSFGSAGQVLTSAGSGANVYWATPTGGSGSPGGSTTQIQFNDSGSFAGSANLTFDSTTTLITLGTSTTNTQINSTAISANSLNVSSKVNVGTGVGFNFGSLAQIEIDSNQNTYSQIVMQNANTGTNASGDVVITADNGTDSVNFVDLGISGSGYSNSQFALHGSLDAYLYSSNSNLVVGTAIDKEIIFHANGFALSDRKLTVNATALTISNSIAVVAGGSNGTLGQMLTSNGTGVYWSTPPGGGGGGEIVSSINTNTTAAAPTTFYIATGTINITLPTAVGNSGLRFNIKNAGLGSITVLPQSGQLINGNINMIIGERNSVMGVISDGTGWNIY